LSYVEMKDIYKVYPPDVVALRGVNLSLQRGEIHSIVGENGAGKSTLMKVLYGLVKPSRGRIVINGTEQYITSPSKAIDLGIGMVHQEFMLIPSFRVYENVMLGSEITRAGFINEERAKQEINRIIEKYGFKLDPEEVTSKLSVSAQQKIEIVKQLFRQVSVLILDEPTAVLTPQETKELFDEVRQLKASGKTIVFISHKLDEVLEISDRITVMRKGQEVGTVNNKGITKKELAKMMVGRDVVFRLKKKSHPARNVIFQASDISVFSKKLQKHLLKSINMEVRSGEIVGIAGIEGNGQLELVRVITGFIKPSSGKILLESKDITDLSTRKRRYLMSYVPQDRKYVALALKASILENTVMTHHLGTDLFKGRIMNWRKANSFAKKLIEEFDILCRGVTEPPSALSGGNQQKVVVAREFSLNTNFIVLDQPTRGLDVGSTEYIRSLILKMRDMGKAVLLISADLDELMELSDRIYVIRNGEIVAEIDPTQTDKETIGRHMLGVHDT